MTNHDQLELVIEVACLTLDRSAAEQRALIDVAHRLDRERAEFTSSNRDPRPPRMAALVVGSWEPSEGRRVGLTSVQLRQQDRMAAAWVRCDACGGPLGAHYEGGRCPS